jgi:hypothetical protein
MTFTQEQMEWQAQLANLALGCKSGRLQVVYAVELPKVVLKNCKEPFRTIYPERSQITPAHIDAETFLSLYPEFLKALNLLPA